MTTHILSAITREMNPEALISFIIPAFNAAPFIADAIRSVINQSCADWELIIIDDNSSDDTLAIARRFAEADSRIRVIHRAEGSGSAYLPRFEAIRASNGRFILPLDADDLILPDYAATLLEILNQAASRHNLDPERIIVYPAEYMWSPPFDPAGASKPGYFDPRREIICRPGRDAVRLTLDGWQVPAAGGIIPRNLYLKAYEDYGIDQGDFIHADEILTRFLMYAAEEVIFSDDAIYYCRAHPESITARRSLRRLDILSASLTLIDFTRQRFGTESEEYMRAHRQLFHWIFDSLQLLSDSAFSRAQRKEGYRRINAARRKIDRKLIRPFVSKRLMALLSLPLPLLRMILRFK